MEHGGYSATTNSTRITSIHGVNFSFNAMTSSISSAILLVPKYPGRFDRLVGIVEGHGRGRTGGFGGFGGSGSGTFRISGRGREAGHYGTGGTTAFGRQPRRRSEGKDGVEDDGDGLLICGSICRELEPMSDTVMIQLIHNLPFR
jgi:hypothetical protein